MKKILLSICFTVSLFFVYSQGPIIKGIYLPVRGTKVKQVYETANPAMAKPNFGAAQTWDYSTSFVNTVDTFDLATYDPNDPTCNCSQYLSYFPGATHVSFLRAPFLFDDSTYSFFRIDTNGVWSVGAYSINSFIKSVGLDTAFITIDDDLFTPASPRFGAIISDTSHYLMHPGTSNAIVRKGYKTLEGVGYGTLKTPAGTFNDVLLAREVNDRWDTLGALGNQHTTFTRYVFIRNNTFGSSVLLMQQMVDTSLAAATYYAWYTLPVDFGSITGTVRDSAGALVSSCPNCKAFLYRENSNFSVHDILDKSDIDASGNYLFDSIPYGIYRVAIRPDTLIYTNALTTFYGDTTDWVAADTINTLACQCNTSGRDITLKYHGSQSNLVNLKGNVSIEIEHWRKNGPAIGPTPLPFGQTIPGVDIIIKKTPSGSAANLAQTGSNGGYAFGKLNNGTYEVMVNLPGLNMASTYSLTVAGNLVDTLLNFVIAKNLLTGKDSIYTVSPGTGVNEGIKFSQTNKSKIYPNPSSGVSVIEFNLINSANVTLELYNSLGENCKSINYGVINPGMNRVNVDFSNLPSGIYFGRILEDARVFDSFIIIKE